MILPVPITYIGYAIGSGDFEEATGELLSSLSAWGLTTADTFLPDVGLTVDLAGVFDEPVKVIAHSGQWALLEVQKTIYWSIWSIGAHITQPATREIRELVIGIVEVVPEVLKEGRKLAVVAGQVQSDLIDKFGARARELLEQIGENIEEAALPITAASIAAVVIAGVVFWLTVK